MFFSECLLTAEMPKGQAPFKNTSPQQERKNNFNLKYNNPNKNHLTAFEMLHWKTKLCFAFQKCISGKFLGAKH